MEYLLGGGVLALTAAFVALAFLNRKDNRELVLAQRNILEMGRLADEYKSGRDVEVAAHAVTTSQLAQATTARAIAEAERNEAKRRYRELLKKHMEDASDDEIAALADDVFSAPGVSASVPAPSRPASHDSDLEVPM